MSTAVLSNPAVLVSCEVDVPDGFSAVDRLNPVLGYPFELGGIINVPLSTDSLGESGFPRVDLIPARGVLLWIVAYDANYEADSERTPHEDASVVQGVGNLLEGHEVQSRWDNVRMWQTTVGVSKTKSCQLFAFAGTSPFAPTSAIDALASTLTLRA